jgi:S-(hydroxymethyl)glutathione dehydrogenase/alcohol dehydrogenase
MKASIVKGAVCNEFGKPLNIEELELDQPGYGEVKVKVKACAICHSDIHSAKGEHAPIKLPAIGGHEIAGIVAEVGEGCSYVKVGDAVIVSIVTPGCGQCYYCLVGQPYNCSVKPLRLAGLGRYVNKKGERLMQFAGGIAVLSNIPLLRKTIWLKFPRICQWIKLLCWLRCNIRIWGGHQPGSSQSLRQRSGDGHWRSRAQCHSGCPFLGAHPVIAADILDSKLESARDLGATHIVNVKTEQDPVKKIFEITQNRGADHVFCGCSGYRYFTPGP